MFYKNPKDYSFVWHWLNKKRSLNGTLVFKADFDQIPDLNALRLSMKKLSEKYPTLKSTIQLSGSYKIYLARNEEDNIIISNQEFDDLESFTEHEVNVDFVPGKRLYYVKLAKLKAGGYGISFNAHHIVGDAVVHSTLADVLLESLFSAKEVDLDKLQNKSHLIARKSPELNLIQKAKLIAEMTLDLLKPSTKFRQINSRRSNKVLRIRVDKTKAERQLSKGSNNALCAAVINAFSEEFDFSNKHVKCLHLANVRQDSHNISSEDFAYACVSGFLVNIYNYKNLDKLIEEKSSR